MTAIGASTKYDKGIDKAGFSKRPLQIFQTVKSALK